MAKNRTPSFLGDESIAGAWIHITGSSKATRGDCLHHLRYWTPPYSQQGSKKLSQTSFSSTILPRPSRTRSEGSHISQWPPKRLTLRSVRLTWQPKTCRPSKPRARRLTSQKLEPTPPAARNAQLPTLIPTERPRLRSVEQLALVYPAGHGKWYAMHSTASPE